MLSSLSEAQIKELPKADLHVHLDGSLRIPTIIELAKEQKIEIPSTTEAGLREKVFKDSYKDLPDYLQGFAVTCSVMQDPEAIERVAYELAWDCFNEGVIYVEPRYSPELLQGDKLSVEDVILAVDRGMAKAKAEIDKTIDEKSKAFEDGEVRSSTGYYSETLKTLQKLGGLPRFNYSHIVCVMRMWEPVRSLHMIVDAVKVREKHGISIDAIDLAGPEHGFPAIDHKEAYTYAHQHFMYKTVHAGEAYGPSSIFQAISELYADRIGHGFHLFSPDLINTHDADKAEQYIQNLVQFIAERRITLEVCLTSNLQTMPELGNDLKKHSLRKMIDHGLSVAICTDNRLVSNTSVTRELMLAQDAFELDAKRMKKIMMYSIKRSFYPGNYLEKKNYIDRCSKYYDYLVAEKFETSPV